MWRFKPLLFCLGFAAAPSLAAEILADAPSNLVVTVYRDPYRGLGSIDLNYLSGFALITETRLVHLPAGLSRVRFEGVADGIEPASAIITGFPDGVIEKNRDARLLSPSVLIASAVGKPVELLRTIGKTGKSERLLGTVLSDAGGGVVFKSAQGIEALRCSGLAETFSFEPAADLSARPTLSVLVKSPSERAQQVTLSYLSRGFDWAANYTATLSADDTHFDLGAWVTLANSNATGFPLAHAQVVAGKVNRESGEVVPIDIGGPILAQCWPRGSTSDSVPMTLRRGSLEQMKFRSLAPAAMAASADALQEVVVTGAKKVQQEQLGDLKLYRVPERTTVASRQSKQVRLMDRFAIPIERTVYTQTLQAVGDEDVQPAYRLLRTTNTKANHLGLPLPAGSVAVFSPYGGASLLEHESDLRDIAVNEEIEINMGTGADVQVAAVDESRSVDFAHATKVPLVPGVVLRSVKVSDVERVEISNAHPKSIHFELRLDLAAGAQVVRADHPLSAKNGKPLFRFDVPANQTVTLRFQIQDAKDSLGVE
jgi:hypothetical protein